MLTRTDFERAVKEAFRYFTRADLLIENPLLEARIMTGRGEGAAGAEALRAMLAETAETLFANPRDQRLYRVLELTYLNPVPKQEAAADRLGLSFSTYRRLLTEGVNRITDWLWRQEQEALSSGQGSPPRAARTHAREAGPHRLSVVVLPFLNLSRDPELDYLVDGIVDSLTTDLSRALPGSFVISRSTAFTFRGRQISVREVGTQLNVRYVLEGSVLAGPEHVRINAQLIDARTEEHLWAERFDKERRDILQVQDEIVGRLSRSVGIELVRNAATRDGARSVDEADAIDLVMRGNALSEEVRVPENADRAVALYRRALELDPVNIDALVGICSTRVYQVLNLYWQGDRTSRLDEAEELITRALALAPDHIGVLKARAALLRARGRFTEAVVATHVVMARNPGEPTAYRELGLNKLYLGKTEEAVEWFRRADRIAPSDLVRWTWLQGLGRALIQLGRDAEAVDALRLAMDSNPGFVRGKAFLAAAEALAGNGELARRLMQEFLQADPGMTVRRFAAERSSVPVDAVNENYLRESERILEGIRRAGMPEE